MTKLIIQIPCFNEQDSLPLTLKELPRQLNGIDVIEWLIIDDGSTDRTVETARANGVDHIIRLISHQGLAKGFMAGISACVDLGADIIVTMDGDGQHDPHDISRLIAPIIEDKYEVVLGSRRKKKGEMPAIKIAANKIGNFITWLLYGLHVSDSQSGFRAYSSYAANIIDTKADKYEYDSKVIREINNNRLSYTEIPIKVRYTAYSKGKPQKQGFVNGIKTLVRMIWDLIV